MNKNKKKRIKMNKKKVILLSFILLNQSKLFGMEDKNFSINRQIEDIKKSEQNNFFELDLEGRKVLGFSIKDKNNEYYKENSKRMREIIFSFLTNPPKNYEEFKDRFYTNEERVWLKDRLNNTKDNCKQVLDLKKFDEEYDKKLQEQLVLELTKLKEVYKSQLKDEKKEEEENFLNYEKEYIEEKPLIENKINNQIKVEYKKIEEIPVKKYLNECGREVYHLEYVFENLKPKNCNIKNGAQYKKILKNIFQKNKDNFSNNEDLFKFISDNFNKEDIVKNFKLFQEEEDDNNHTVLGFNKTDALFDILEEEDFAEIKKSFKEYFIKEHMDMKNEKIKPSKYW